MNQTNPLWKATYDAGSPEEMLETYSDWASDYDADTIDGMGYVGPTLSFRQLDGLLDSTDARVLDAGCGTGLVGELMKENGYSKVDAMDLSREMLLEAENKNVYDRLFTADMSKRLDIDDNRYDAVICVGTFTYAHVGPEAFSELARVTRPDGYICFTVRDGAYQAYNYRNTMVELEADNTWELMEMRREDYLKKENVTAAYCAYKVLGDHHNA